MPPAAPLHAHAIWSDLHAFGVPVDKEASLQRGATRVRGAGGSWRNVAAGSGKGIGWQSAVHRSNQASPSCFLFPAGVGIERRRGRKASIDGPNWLVGVRRLALIIVPITQPQCGMVIPPGLRSWVPMLAFPPPPGGTAALPDARMCSQDTLSPAAHWLVQSEVGRHMHATTNFERWVVWVLLQPEHV